jgi:uncharacterized protein YgiM (DUF1202 family)
MLLIPIGLSFADAALADTMYVSARSAQVRAGKTSLDQVVALVKLGEPVEVLKRDGRWLHVRTAQGAAGWLFDNSLSASKPAGGESDLAALGRNFRGSDATNVSASAGARGLDKATEGYANRSGITPQQRAAVDRMTAYKIADDEVQAFLKAGRLGEYAE